MYVCSLCSEPVNSMNMLIKTTSVSVDELYIRWQVKSES